MHAVSEYNLLNMAETRTALSTRKVFLAVLSGVMLTASFPPGNLSFLAWFTLVPLLKGFENGSPSLAFKLGLIAGTTHYLTLIYWVVVVLGHYGNLNTFATLGPFLLLCLYMALYLAVFSSLTAFLAGSRFVLFFMACFWVGLEYGRAKLLTGFPWCLLGYTQFKHLHLIQVVDLCGVYGLSFLIVLINGLVYRLLFQQNRKAKGFLKWEILITALIAGGALAYGHYRLSEYQMAKKSCLRIKAAVIQANIDQSIKWDPAYQTKTMATYQNLTRTSLSLKPKLILWAETSVPFFFQDNSEFSPKVLSLAKESGALLILGSPAYERISGVTKYYNRAYLVTPDDRPLQYYDKVHLVPFGEYVPLKRFLFFLNRLVSGAGDFKPGDKIVTLNHGGLSIGMLICFEAIFPELARAHARQGANILVNLTNDAWYGMTSAPYQHFIMSVFRAVENRMPMIRAANTGFSAFIEPQGKITTRSSLFTEEILDASLDISRPPLTFYARFGDLFAFTALIVSLMRILSGLRHKLLRNT